LAVLDKYTCKYNFNGIFNMTNISLLKFTEQNQTYLNMFI
jgi:hypothetical protein